MSGENVECEEKWRKAYLAQMRDGAVGRMFAGTLHNINGAVQAISMQSELMSMMQIKTRNAFEDLCKTGFVAGDSAPSDVMRESLLKQEELLGKMHEKMQFCFSVLKKSVQADSLSMVEGDTCSLNTLVQNEIDFLCSDSFFKHKIVKKMSLGRNMPCLKYSGNDLGYVVFVLLDNALQALLENGESVASEIHIHTFIDKDFLVLQVKDNGFGISRDFAEQIFAPFFSTRSGCAGLGLYLARQIVMDHGGSLECDRRSAPTSFTLSLPLKKSLQSVG
jgi:signal transduction histidine kinase